jgi:hypothetical protein
MPAEAEALPGRSWAESREPVLASKKNGNQPLEAFTAILDEELGQAKNDF